jgi:hypothetical protein
VEDVDSFVSVPEGEYLCKIAEVRAGTSKEGAPHWNLRLEVAEGDYAGRTAGWDSITWSTKGVRRVKIVLTALGFDTRGELELEPDELVGLRARVRLTLEEREDAFSGRRQLRLKVPFEGWARADPDGDGDLATWALDGSSTVDEGAPEDE